MNRFTLLRASRALLLASLLVVGAVALPTAASATTVDECQAQLAQLRADTVAAQGSFTNANDFDRAVAKLDAATAQALIAEAQGVIDCINGVGVA